MQTVLDLQKMDAPALDSTVFGDSSGSSWSGCCNGNIDQIGA